MSGKSRITLSARLASHLDKSTGPDGCWVWTASTIRGYGQIAVCVNGRQTNRLAHRIAYELHHGVTLDDECVLHRCDNPPCCNPAHLFLGDRNANAKDMVAKGRQRNGIVPGERHGRSKITADAVREMRRAYTANEANQHELAKRFGVTQYAVWSIVHRRTWKHIP